MEKFKTKSLSPEYTDVNVNRLTCSTRFISFESAIRSFSENYNITEKPVGYNVTEGGIEILYK